MKPYLLFSHAIAFILVTIIHSVIYFGIQQTYRTGADDPQTALIDEISHDLENNLPVDRFFSAAAADLKWSSMPFVALYDSSQRPLRSSASINSKFPLLPAGVLDEAARTGSNHVTWQPDAGTRLAIVVKRLNKGPVAFAASGRSLHYVEMRTSSLLKMIFLSWTACILILGIHLVIVTRPITLNKTVL
jgi:hypothetical protein